ncbi:MAG: 4-hydroxy-tetrahydrodipicolinate synthase [Fluviicola sp.]|nr:4-hydroxy-tetrahydrodipicolinate synthase [Fluviicola sp.]
MNQFKGAGVALVTPFLADMSIDFPALRRLVREQIAGGTNFLVVQGTTGESPTLNANEKKQVLETVLEENNGALPIVYGVGGNNTMAVAEAFKQIPAGVDGILSVAPYYNKPIQRGFVAHYKAIAEATDLPIIMYNVPGRTGSNMLAETTLELAEVKNIVAMKEASGNMEQIMEIIRCKPEGFLLLSGDDAITMPLIAAGADGVISVVANSFPAQFSQMVAASLNGDLATARKLHYDLLPITKLFFTEGNPGGVKIALEELGWMAPHMRLPLVQVSDALKQAIVAATKQLK